MSDIATFLKESRFGKMAVLVLFILAAYIAVLTVNALKEYQYIGADVPPMNTITVSGEGEVFSVPDTAEFSFSVVAEAADAERAQNASAEKINAILAYLTEEGVEETDIKTTGYNLYPRYEYRARSECVGFNCPQGERELVGFEVNQTVQVRLEGTTEAGNLLSGVGARGATNVSGLSFTVEDEDALLSQARADAIDDAKEKARVLADQLGVRLVRIVSFNEGGNFPMSARMEFAADQALGLGGGVAPSLPAGENKLTSNVSITYEIR